MRLLALSAACLMAAVTQAGAQSLPAGETTYVERSLNHTDTLVIEHPPVAENPYGRRNGQAAIAGYCREGGLIRRRDAFGNPVILRQREICDGRRPAHPQSGRRRAAAGLAGRRRRRPARAARQGLTDAEALSRSGAGPAPFRFSHASAASTFGQSSPSSAQNRGE